MARQYVITEEEMQSLIDSLELYKLKETNTCDPMRALYGVSNGGYVYTEEDKKALERGVHALHGGFHLTVVRWAQQMGFTGHRRIG